MASTSGVTAGLISKTDYDAFNTKLSNSLTSNNFWVGNASNIPVATAVSADTFTQYALLAGRAGGQNLRGGTAASENLTLDSTANATKSANAE